MSDDDIITNVHPVPKPGMKHPHSSARTLADGFTNYLFRLIANVADLPSFGINQEEEAEFQKQLVAFITEHPGEPFPQHMRDYMQEVIDSVTERYPTVGDLLMSSQGK